MQDKIPEKIILYAKMNFGKYINYLAITSEITFRGIIWIVIIIFFWTLDEPKM
jgi:hypothetical protein